MTLAEARHMLPGAKFVRISDGDGVALVEVTFGEGDSVVVWAGEEDPDAPIDWSGRILTLSTTSETFHTSQGIRPGALVVEVIKTLGPVREIVVSEIESREFIAFAAQPSWLVFRLDYSGIFASGARRTKAFKGGARILAISVSSEGR
jgi:hypothetical protein